MQRKVRKRKRDGLLESITMLEEQKAEVNAEVVSLRDDKKECKKKMCCCCSSSSSSSSSSDLVVKLPALVQWTLYVDNK